MIKPFSTTGIGSLPHKNPREACELILRTFDIPFWPQLPKISVREFMIPQYAEGLPFLNIGADGEVWVKRSGSDELERFYESWSDNTRIAISEDHAIGLHTFLKLLKGKKYPILKGHITGPLTFSLGLKDSEGKAVYYDEELREICLMLLKAKVRWQVDLLRQQAEQVIIFIDEPIFSALGSSSYLGVNSDEVLRLIGDITKTVRDEGGVAGIHCCGNADWPLVFRSGADIVNFDAFDYLDTLALYPEEIGSFLESGGILAWGIVPTSDAISDHTPDSIRERFDQGMERLGAHISSELLRSRIMLTPSCGTGSRTVEETLKIFQLLLRLKEELA